MRSSTIGLMAIAIAGAIILTLSILGLVSSWFSFLALFVLGASLFVLGASLFVTLFSK